KGVENELKYLGMSLANYEDIYGKKLPPGRTMTAEGKLMHGWASYLMPSAWYSMDLDFSVPWNEPPNARFFKCNLRMFVNPSIPGPYFDAEGFGLAHIAG